MLLPVAVDASEGKQLLLLCGAASHLHVPGSSAVSRRRAGGGGLHKRCGDAGMYLPALLLSPPSFSPALSSLDTVASTASPGRPQTPCGNHTSMTSSAKVAIKATKSTSRKRCPWLSTPADERSFSVESPEGLNGTVSPQVLQAPFLTSKQEQKGSTQGFCRQPGSSAQRARKSPCG